MKAFAEMHNEATAWLLHMSAAVSTPRVFVLV